MSLHAEMVFLEVLGSYVKRGGTEYLEATIASTKVQGIPQSRPCLTDYIKSLPVLYKHIADNTSAVQSSTTRRIWYYFHQRLLLKDIYC